jgi:hypothetical protein
MKVPKLTDRCRCGHPYADHLTGVGECGHYDIEYGEPMSDDPRANVPNTVVTCGCEEFASAVAA